uniref:Nitrate transporter n=1 Tax=Rhizophora mucronata TaxID=61149 RepID=A0A2P2JRB6_RHIMU
MKAPTKGTKLFMPLQMLIRFAADTCFKWNTLVKYTIKLDNNPMLANLSRVSFPAKEINGCMWLQSHQRSKIELARKRNGSIN